MTSSGSCALSPWVSNTPRTVPACGSPLCIIIAYLHTERITEQESSLLPLFLYPIPAPSRTQQIVAFILIIIKWATLAKPENLATLLSENSN